MLTAQKGVESRKRGHGVDLSTCINAACDRQLHFDMVRPFLRLRQLDFPRPVAGYDVRVRLVDDKCIWPCRASRFQQRDIGADIRSEEHTSELQSLMRISYAVFCLKKKKHIQYTHIR